MSSKVTPIRPQPGGSQAKAVISEFKSGALESITDLLDAMFDGADDALFDFSENADNTLHQGVYYDAMRAVRLARPEITQAFIHALSQVIDHGENADPERALMDLSLMPSAELEENVAISNMISRASSLLRQELAQLQAKLQALAEQAPGTIDPNGLSPGGLCHSFREAMAPVDFEIEIKLLIYKLFERSVLGELGATYRQLQDFLKTHEVEPKRQSLSNETGHAAGAAAPSRHGRGARWSERLQELRGEVTPENQFGSDEVMQLLESLHEQVDANRQAHEYAPGELIETLLDLLRSGQTDSTPRSLPRRQRQLIGMVTAMFNHIYADGELNPASRQLLSRARVPVMKTALIDPAFFRDADHPARRLVNEIATLGAIAPAEDAPLYIEAATLMDRLVSEFERDPGVLETVADELQALGIRFVKSREASFQRPALLERAKRVAVLEIRQQALGRRIPESMRPFLLKAWGPLMAYRYIRHGLDSSPWRHAGEILTRLLDAVAPPDAETDRETLAQEHTVLLTQVRKHLRELSTGRARITQLTEGLELTFAGVLTSEAQLHADNDEELLAHLAAWATADETMFDDEGDHDATSAAFASVLTESSLPEQQATPPPQDTPDEPSPLPAEDAANLVKSVCVPGTWFQLYAGGPRMRWLRFREFDEAAQLVRFANRDNDIAYERSAVEFTQDLRAGRSQPIYEQAEFEQKLEQIISMQARPSGSD